MANLFICFEPLAGGRRVEVTKRKTSVDFTRFVKAMSEVHYPDAERIALVCDNLSTRSPAAFYEAFTLQEARRLAQRFEWHHGSWLDVAEMELSVLARQCLASAEFRMRPRWRGKWLPGNAAETPRRRA